MRTQQPSPEWPSRNPQKPRPSEPQKPLPEWLDEVSMELERSLPHHFTANEVRRLLELCLALRQVQQAHDNWAGSRDDVDRLREAKAEAERKWEGK